MVTMRYIRTWCDYHLSLHKEVEATQRIGLVLGADSYEADLCDEDFNQRTLAEIFAIANKLSPKPDQQVHITNLPEQSEARAEGDAGPKEHLFQEGNIPWNKGKRLPRRYKQRDRTPCPFCQRMLTGQGMSNHLRVLHPQEYVKMYPDRLTVVGTLKSDSQQIRHGVAPSHVIPPGAKIRKEQ